MKFPVLNTVTQANLPIILTCWAFGLGVLEFPFGRRRRTISVIWSIANFLIHLGFVWIVNFPQIVEIQGSKIAASNYRSNAYFCVVFVGFSLSMAHINAKKIGMSFYELEVINGRLEIMGIPKDYNVNFRSQMFQQCIGFTAILVIVALDLKYVDFQLPNEMSQFGFLWSFHYLLAFSFAVDSCMSNSIRYYGNRFRHLNELLVESASLAIENKTTSTRLSNNQFPRYDSVINEIYRNHSMSLKAMEKRSLLYVLRETRKIHHSLCSTVIEMNQAFGIQILLSVALTFGLITTLFYTTYILALASPPVGSDVDVWIVRFIALTWIMFYALKILLVVEACESTSCEAKRTHILISELRDAPASDEDVRDEINIFSLQLIQNPLNITANRFFTLNYELIRGMIGSVTTYLIIMIQMRSVYEPEMLDSNFNSTIFSARMNNTN